MSTRIIFFIVVYSFWILGFSSCNTKRGDKNLIIMGTDILSDFKAKPDESINIKKLKEHLEKYPDRWNTAMKFLIDTDLENLSPGRIDLDENVYAAVSEYETKNHSDALFESHREYIDLQYIISGEELIGLTNSQTLPVYEPYSEENDIVFYRYDEGKLLKANPEKYFIFFPDDIHRPCMKTEKRQAVKKIVMKIRYKE